MKYIKIIKPVLARVYKLGVIMCKTLLNTFL